MRNLNIYITKQLFTHLTTFGFWWNFLHTLINPTEEKSKENNQTTYKKQYFSFLFLLFCCFCFISLFCFLVFLWFFFVFFLVICPFNTLRLFRPRKKRKGSQNRMKTKQATVQLWGKQSQSISFKITLKRTNK